MSDGYERHTIVWRDIAIEVRWNRTYYTSDIYSIAHLELHAEDKRPLPVTETGYRSHFVQRGNVEAYGGPVEYAKAWLEEAALSAEWKRYIHESKQLTLF